jgi:micrococcal nuclease
MRDWLSQFRGWEGTAGRVGGGASLGRAGAHLASRVDRLSPRRSEVVAVVRALVLSSVAIVTLASCAALPTGEPGTAVVREVVDGDTVTVDIAGRREDVRLLGIDTPETVHPTKPVECFGPEASARTAALLPPGTEVRLERDVEARDHYGRLLAYVHRLDDGLFVNRSLVVEGFADVLIIEPNSAHAADLRDARDQAQREGRGRWSAC